MKARSTLPNQDEARMSRAMKLAEHGRGSVSPNPMVGAGLYQGNRLISEGYHRSYGGAHAEAEAIQKQAEARGAALYVTLEPCSTWGKTPPCTRAIIESGVRRVVVGAIDPNPSHAGRGIKILRQAGLGVTVGTLRPELERQNEAFRKWIRTKRPFVILKMAQSLDGKIATRMGNSRWISGKEARVFVHRLRAGVDGIAVGKNTLLQDNPELTVRHVPAKRFPWRIVFSVKGDLPPRSKIFQGKAPTLLICSKRFFKNALNRYGHMSIFIMPVSEKNHRLNLDEALKKLGALGIQSLLVEGGGELAASFVEARLVDKVYFVITPKIIGGRAAKTAVEGNGVSRIASAFPVKNLKIISLGNDFIAEGYLD